MTLHKKGVFWEMNAFIPMYIQHRDVKLDFQQPSSYTRELFHHNQMFDQ